MKPPKNMWVIYHQCKGKLYLTGIEPTRTDARIFCNYYNGFSKTKKDRPYKYYKYEVKE